MVEEDWCGGLVDAEFGDESKAADLEVGRESGGENGRSDGELPPIRIVEIFGAEREAEPSFRVDVQIEGAPVPDPGVIVFFGGHTGNID